MSMPRLTFKQDLKESFNAQILLEKLIQYV